MIATLEASQPKTSEDQDRIAHEVANLKNKKRFLVQNPNVLVRAKKKSGLLPRRKRMKVERALDEGGVPQELKRLSRSRLVELAGTPTNPLAAALLMALARGDCADAALRVPSPCWPPSPRLGATLLLQRQGELVSNEVSAFAPAIPFLGTERGMPTSHHYELPELLQTAGGIDGQSAVKDFLLDPPLPLEPGLYHRGSDRSEWGQQQSPALPASWLPVEQKAGAAAASSAF